jgi:hypothetical protein
MTKLKSVYGILPAIVRYTETMPKPWHGGFAKYCYIRIRSKYLKDNGILQHELVHVKQFYRLFLLFMAMAAGLFIYSLSHPYLPSYLGCMALAILSPVAHRFMSNNFGWYRLRIEVEAYKEQLKHYDDDRTELFAHFLSTREYYKLDITKEEAIELLKGS